MYRLCPKEEKCTVLGIVPKKKTKAMEQQNKKQQQQKKSKQTSKQKTTTSQENISNVEREEGEGMETTY